MSSLFGNVGNSAQPQTAPTSSLFGTPATTQAGGTSSLFGNSNTTQPQQQQQQSSLFSNVGGQQKPSLFGNLGMPGSQQQSSTEGSGGLFGNAQPATSQAQETSSLFGAPGKAAASQPMASSLFAPQQAQRQQQDQQGQQQQEGGHLGPITNKGAQPAYFDSLLEKGRKRIRNADGGNDFNELPSLQLGLTDIAKRARELGATGMQAEDGRGADSRA